MLFPRRDIWWIYFEHLGKGVEKSTGISGASRGKNRARAERRADEIKVEHRKENPSLAKGCRLSQLAAIDIARALAAGADPATRRRTIKGIWLPMRLHWGDDCDPSTLKEPDFTAYVAARRLPGKNWKHGAAGQTIVREREAFFRCMGIAKQRGLVVSVPPREWWPKIKRSPAKKTQKGKLHPPAVIAAVLAKVPIQIRRKALFDSATGLRSGELARFSLAWVEPAPDGCETEWIIRVPDWAAKNRRERVLGLPQWALEIAQQEVVAHPDRDEVFGSSNHGRAFREACAELGYKPAVTMRDLRHTFGTLALKGTADPWAALQVLGHSDLRTTSVYQSTTVQRASATAAAVSKIIAEWGAESGGPLLPGVEIVNESGGVDGTRTRGLRRDRRCPHCNHPISLDAWGTYEHVESRKDTAGLGHMVGDSDPDSEDVSADGAKKTA